MSAQEQREVTDAEIAAREYDEGAWFDAERYRRFIERKSQLGGEHGFAPLWMPDFLYDFQKHLVEWALLKGRAAIFADCGLGKTPMQLVWAENVRRKTNGNVLILTPLAVAAQTIREAAKFDIEAAQSRDGKIAGPITVTNYEQLHHFDREQFVGVVCDESSILKSFSGATRKLITRFMNKIPYRLLCTATAAPNDYIELGTSSEALGELTYTEMLSRFFKYLDDKGQKRDQAKLDAAEKVVASNGDYYQKLSYRVSQSIGQWRLKHHAVVPFWQWVASWARACRMPSDLGFPDDGFILPPLVENDHIITTDEPPPGMMFNLPALGLYEERQERRRTLKERCEKVASLVDHKRQAVVWCQMNDEGDRLEKVIDGAMQVAGKTPDEKKVELYEAFLSGALRVLVIKPKIGAWGLNWQHCNHVVSFASHSYEQYYQSVRRCWRYGQTKPVTVDIIATEGEVRVLGNMRSKAVKATRMFEALVEQMNGSTKIERVNIYTKGEVIPSWLSKNS